MPNKIPFEKLIRTAMRFGAQFAEVFVEERRSVLVSCDDNRLENASTVFDVGIGIRAMADMHTAYGATSDFSERGLIELAKTVGKAAMAKEARPGKIILVESKSVHSSTVQQHPLGVSLEKKCDAVLRANELVWKLGANIRQAKVQYRDVDRRIIVASSDGVFAEDEQVLTSFLVQVIASEGKVVQTGQESVGSSTGFELLDVYMPEVIAERAAARAERMLGAREAPSGKMPVVISSEAGGTMIHEAVGHGLEADLAYEGNSVYAEKLGEKVASDLVSVCDDPTLKGNRGSFAFDDEGTPAQKTLLIENGILRAYMSDKSLAERTKTQSSGNSRRQSYRFAPIVRMTNTMILPGRDDPSEVLSSTPFGLFVKRMGGGQVNTINRDFVFDVQEGYLIENGKIGEPVRGATLIGNGPQILLSIDKVGSDLGFSIGTCGKEGQESPVSCGQPTIRIPEIVVGGRSK